MNAPVDYCEMFLPDTDAVFRELWNSMPWERRSDAPRREAWMCDGGRSYTYGRGAGRRTYAAAPWPALVSDIKDRVSTAAGASFECCFANGYEGPRDHLGWHADDSPEIDDERPIAVVSLGSARRILFRRKGEDEAEELLLAPGSLLIMHAGMQNTHEHRIPKHPAACGPRISLTFRGLSL